MEEKLRAQTSRNNQRQNASAHNGKDSTGTQLLVTPLMNFVMGSYQFNPKLSSVSHLVSTSESTLSISTERKQLHI